MLDDQVSGYFFDFDGVLVDSTAVKTEAYRKLFASYSPDVITRIVDYHRQHGGISRVEKIRYGHENIIGVPLSKRQLAEWSERYSQLVLETVVAANWIAGAYDFLEKYYRQTPIFVISGTPETELVEVIRRRNMVKYFKEMRGSPVKKPEHVRDLVRRYGLFPEKCVFVGDALTDYHTAEETGVPFIGIYSEVSFPPGTCVLPDCRGLEETIADLLC